MHYFYIIFSKSKDKFYIGETVNISQRIIKHSNHSYKGSFTKIASDWKIAIEYKCKNKDDALFLEAFVKRMKNRKFILKIINNQNILKDILEQRK